MLLKSFGFICLLFFMPIIGLAATYPMPRSGNDIIGEVYTARAQPGDTLSSIGLRHGISLHEMMEANPKLGMDNHLRAGRRVVIPAQFILPKYRQGIVINMAELRLYYFTPDGKYVMTFPVAMGRDQWRSPTVQTKVIAKEVDPTWHVPESIREYAAEHGKYWPEVVPPGPDNPLGPYALVLAKSGYLIHGNNASSSIGKFVSSGCVRMKNADIKSLFDQATVGTPVRIVHYPNKIGWFNGIVYQESQMPVALPEGQSEYNQVSLDAAIIQGLGGRPAYIDRKASQQTARQHLGIPEPIGSAVNASNEVLESHPPMPMVAEETSPNDSQNNPTKSVAMHETQQSNDENDEYVDTNWEGDINWESDINWEGGP